MTRSSDRESRRDRPRSLSPILRKNRGDRRHPPPMSRSRQSRTARRDLTVFPHVPNVSVVGHQRDRRGHTAVRANPSRRATTECRPSAPTIDALPELPSRRTRFERRDRHTAPFGAPPRSVTRVRSSTSTPASRARAQQERVRRVLRGGCQPAIAERSEPVAERIVGRARRPVRRAHVHAFEGRAPCASSSDKPAHVVENTRCLGAEAFGARLGAGKWGALEQAHVKTQASS